jgi:hypothetical protein
MSAGYKTFLRVVTGILGFWGLLAVGFIGYELFISFSVWKLLLIILGAPGAALFLFYAFHREPRLPVLTLDGSGGADPASVLWPSPSKPPSLSAKVEAAIPEDGD